MRKAAVQKGVLVEDVPDNTVFWSIVGVISVFVVVLAAVMIVRSGATGRIVLQWSQPEAPFEANPYACLDVPPCGSEVSFLCCAEQPLPGTGIKCVAPLAGSLGTTVYGSPYERPGTSYARCPPELPNRCTCPEKYQYRQSWPVPSR